MDQGPKVSSRDVVDVTPSTRTPSRKHRNARPRRNRVRSKTFAHRDIVREIRETRARDLVRETLTDPVLERPKLRSECRDGYRPCPWVGCAHHLYLNVNPNGSIKITFPDTEPWDMKHTCSLDVAEAGSHTLEEIGTHMNLTRERARQIEVYAIDKLYMASDVARIAADERLAAYVTPTRDRPVDGPAYDD